METVQFLLPKNHLPVFKGAARQLGIDLFTDNEDDQFYMATVIVSEHSQLVYLGFIAATDAAFNTMKNDMFGIQNMLEKMVDNFKKNNNENDTTIG